MKKSIKFIVLILITQIIVSCEDEHEIGVLKVKGINDVYFKLYQKDELEMFTAIDYQILGKGFSEITPRKYLRGTDLYEDDLKNFNAYCYDSLVYLTYCDTNIVEALFDLKTNKGYPNLNGNWNTDIKIGKKLLSKLQQHKPYLVGGWSH